MDKPDFSPEALQLRILFGPLFGSDISIPDKEIFFYVGEDLSDNRRNAEAGNRSEHFLNRSIDTLYIPYRAGQPNFRLRFSRLATSAPEISDLHADAPPPPQDFEVDFLSDDGTETQYATFNSVCRFGDIAFAVKRRQDAWSDAITQYAPQPTLDPAVAQAASDERVTPRVGLVRFALKLGIVLVASATLSALAYWVVRHYVGAQKLATVSSVLTGSPERNAILATDDGRIYVLSASQDGAEWDREALLKAALPEQVEVAVIDTERLRLERHLDEAGIDFVTVRLDIPERPELIVSDRLPAAARASAVSALRLAAPYVKNVRVIDANVGAIEQEARNALDKIGARYRLLTRRGGATFEVATSFGDEELAALQNLMHSFSHKWGTRRVDFKIALRTDWLKGKSYREGGDGYVLLDHASWYFPQPLEGVNSQ